MAKNGSIVAAVTLVALALVGAGVLGAHAPAGEQRVPLDHVEVHVEEALLEVLLDDLVHRQRLHLARAGGRGLHLDLQGLLAL
jgi:hypothetical protein